CHPLYNKSLLDLTIAMGRLRLSFSQKVQLYACTVGLISLLFAGIAFVVLDAKHSHAELEKALQFKVDLINHSLGQALATNQHEKTKDIIEYFKKNPEII
ncbi:MAG TPA: hypothetical protein PLD88_01945, partial [Candidatus Berkiella sp.]|nr:hypothetical protein [Candidatus Berkiella sp.]